MRRLLLLLCAVVVFAEPSGSEFPQVFNQWATLANARAEKPGTVDAREYLAWQKVKTEWRRLERNMDKFYGQ